MNTDAVFSLELNEVSCPFRLRIVCDSLMVIAEKKANAGEYIYKVYSLNSLSYIGAAIRRGRGPEEFLAPHIVRGCSTDRYMCLSDNDEGCAYAMDVLESIHKGHPIFANEFCLPQGTVDWLPVSDSSHFSLVMKGEELFYQTSRSNGEIIGEFHPYPDIDGSRCATQLSELLLNSGDGGKIASVMMVFPQINIFDITAGTVHSTAVNREYSNWRALLNRPIDHNTVQYYDDAAASPEYIFASYAARPLKDILKGDYTTSIHIFDWEGSWLYDIKVEEKVDAMAYDSKGKYLYVIDKTEDRLVRYDFRNLL